MQTLLIASAASVTAAMVTARFFPPGTIYASAVMPVIVAAVSELLHRPANRLSVLREERRTVVREARQLQSARVLGEDPGPLRGAPEFAQGADAPEAGFASTTNGKGHTRDPLDGVRIHGRTRRPSPPRIHPKAVIATGLAAFAVGAAALTLPELIFGGSLATSHETTYFGGGGHRSSPPASTGTQAQPAAKTVTQTTTAPAQPPSQSTTTSQSQTATTPSGTSPSGGATAPTQTSTGSTSVPAPPTP
jgi:hypothetical protein